MNFALLLAVTVVFASFASQLVRVHISYGRTSARGKKLPTGFYEVRRVRTWVVSIILGRGGGYIFGRTIQFGRFAKGGDYDHTYSAKPWLATLNGRWYPDDSNWQTWNLARQGSTALPSHGVVGCLRSWANTYRFVD